MIFGAHVTLYSKDAEADRNFLCDVLGFQSVNAGHGWQIFALPPAEITALEFKGVTCSEVQEARWGSITRIQLPSGGEADLYQPKPAMALKRDAT